MLHYILAILITALVVFLGHQCIAVYANKVVADLKAEDLALKHSAEVEANKVAASVEADAKYAVNACTSDIKYGVQSIEKKL